MAAAEAKGASGEDDDDRSVAGSEAGSVAGSAAGSVAGSVVASEAGRGAEGATTEAEEEELASADGVANGGGEQASAKADDVVDAEFEEVKDDKK